MTDDEVHATLLSISAGYREFYAEEVRDHEELMSWDTDPDPYFMVRAFAGWLVVGAQMDEFVNWTAAQFRREQEHYNS